MKTWIGTLGVIVAALVVLCSESIAEELHAHVKQDKRVGLLKLDGRRSENVAPPNDRVVLLEGWIEVRIESGKGPSNIPALCFEVTPVLMGDKPPDVCIKKDAPVDTIDEGIWQLNFTIANGRLTAFRISNVKSADDIYAASSVVDREPSGGFPILRLRHSPGCYYTDSIRIC